MDEAAKYSDAIQYANKNMIGKESIVSNSIISSLEGEYGNYHKTFRTDGSQLWINPLMTIYWCFDLRKVISRIIYYEQIKNVNTISEFNAARSKYRNQLETLRSKKQIPI